MNWCDFAKLLSQVDSSWSVTDDDLSNDRDRHVDVYVLLSGRNHHLAEMAYVLGKIIPKELRVNTRVLRVTQGLMDPNDL